MVILDPSRWRGFIRPGWIDTGAEVDQTHPAAIGLIAAVVFNYQYSRRAVDLGPWRLPFSPTTTPNSPVAATHVRMGHVVDGPQGRLFEQTWSPYELSSPLKPTSNLGIMCYARFTKTALTVTNFGFGPTIRFNAANTSPFHVATLNVENGLSSVVFSTNSAGSLRSTNTFGIPDTEPHQFAGVLDMALTAAEISFWVDGSQKNTRSCSTPTYGVSPYIGGGSGVGTEIQYSYGCLWNISPSQDLLRLLANEPWAMFKPTKKRTYVFVMPNAVEITVGGGVSIQPGSWF